jgi:hypothetical protein
MTAMPAASASAAPPAHRAQPRGGLATLVVFLVMIGIVGGGYVASNAVADLPAQPVEVARGVVVTPVANWDFGGRSSDGNTVLISKGDGSLAVSVSEGTDVTAALTRLRDEWTASGTVTASPVEPVTDRRGGQQGLRFAYSGSFSDTPAPVEGEVIGFAGSGLLVVFDGWASMGDYIRIQPDVAAMIDAAVIP